MAKCPTCNVEQEEGTVFCASCGALMSGAYDSNNVPNETGILTKIRTLGSSPLMLVIALLNTLLLAGGLVKAFMTFAQNPSSGFTFGMSFPGILVCIALWLIYSTCKKPAGSILSTSGVTIIRVLKIISLITSIILLILTIGMGVVVIGFIASNGANIDFSQSTVTQETVTSYISGVTAGLVLCAFFWMLYNIFGVRFFGSVSRTAKTGFPESKSALPLAIFKILLGLASLGGIYALMNASAFIDPYMPSITAALESAATESNIPLSPALITGYLESLSMGNPLFVLTVVTSIVSALYFILSAVAVLNYRKAVNEEKANYKY